MNYGEEHRKYRATHMHDHSSRSHTIFRIILESHDKYAQNNSKYSTLNLVDLAGSERLQNGMISIKKDQRGETKHINKSLFTLANVIKILASNN
jgi:centromeric protein E